MGDLKIGVENGRLPDVLILVSYLIFKFYFDLFDVNIVVVFPVILPMLYNSNLCIVLTNYSFSPQPNVCNLVLYSMVLHLNHASVLLLLILVIKSSSYLKMKW